MLEFTFPRGVIDYKGVGGKGRGSNKKGFV